MPAEPTENQLQNARRAFQALGAHIAFGAFGFPDEALEMSHLFQLNNATVHACSMTRQGPPCASESVP